MRKCFPKVKCRRVCVTKLAGSKDKLELTGVKTRIPIENNKYPNIFFAISHTPPFSIYINARYINLANLFQ